MAMSKKLKNITKEDWRKLGFYYERDDESKKWVFIGSKYGLEDFCAILEKYSRKLKNDKIGEHDHIGPYSYLKIMTSDTFEITADYICGGLKDFIKFSKLLKDTIKNSEVNSILKLDKELCVGSKFCIELRIMEYGFDPATADIQLWD